MLDTTRRAMQAAELDVDKLIAEARKTAGLDDFGPYEFRTALPRLLATFAKEVPLSAAGIAILKADIVRLLVNRLRMQRDISAHPEILDEDVSDPFIIVGLPRSGTTKLHKMLSAPDTVQKTLFWKMINPAPFPNADPDAMDPRIAAVMSSDLLTDDKPDMNAAHRIALEEVEEEGLVYQMSFKDFAWDVLLNSRDYFEWLMAEPSDDNYRLAKTVFQYLQWQDGGKRGRPWVFKSVPHLAHLDMLMKYFPNATLIQSHRDPSKCIPSFAKFTTELSQIYAEQVDKHQRGKHTLYVWSVALDRFLATRESMGLDTRILDVDFDTIRNDPMSAIREAYARSPHELTEHAAAPMEGWHRDNEQGKHGRHAYNLEEFGLSEEDIEAAFGSYRARFLAGK